MYLYIKTKYGQSYWSQKFQAFGSIFLATWFDNEEEMSSASCYCMDYEYKYYQSQYLELENVGIS